VLAAALAVALAAALAAALATVIFIRGYSQANSPATKQPETKQPAIKKGPANRSLFQTIVTLPKDN
jgi:hypothetical protein